MEGMRLKCVQMVGNCLRGTERGELRADDFEALTGAVCFCGKQEGEGGWLVWRLSGDS